MYQQYRKDKAKSKLKRRLKLAKAERSSKEGKSLRRERLASNKQQTIENTRDFNPTVLNLPNTHEVPEWMKSQEAPPTSVDAQDEEDEEDEEEDIGEEEKPDPEADKLADELAKTHIQS